MTHYHYGQDGHELAVVDTSTEAGRALQREKDSLLRIKCDNNGSTTQRGHEHAAYRVSLMPRHGVLYDLRPRPCHSDHQPVALWMRGPCARSHD